MAEDEKASRFLKKSKWGKILKQKDKQDDTAQPQRQATFTLNDDVADFLKPSTEKQMPKIDIAIAKRWPEAQEVRAAGQPSPAPQAVRYSKPRRREGLAVAFVKTQPEIIGEGGDDALEPTKEIARLKAMVSRSISDRRPGSVDQGQGQWTRSPPLLQQAPKMSSLPVTDEDTFVPTPLRRVQTSHNEFSPAMQRKVASPPSEAAEPHRPSIGRVPTGFDSYIDSTTPLVTPIDRLDPATNDLQHEKDRPRSRDRPPQIDTQFGRTRLIQDSTISQLPVEGLVRKPYTGLSPGDTISPIAQKKKEMRANEGAAFRRASMLINQGVDDEGDSPPQSRQMQSAALTQPSPSLSSHPSLTPETAITPDGPNPFADPKYIKRHSRETSPEQVAPYQSLQQMARNQSSRYATIDNGHDGSADHLLESPGSSGRQPSEVHHVQQYGHQRVPSHERNYMGWSQSSGVPGFQHSPQHPHAPSQHVSNPQANQGYATQPMAPRYPYLSANEALSSGNRPNASSSSVNNLPRGPSHSRTSSRDGSSPSLLPPPGPNAQQSLSPQSPRYHAMYSQNPTDQSSKTSLLGPGRGNAPLEPSPKPRGSPDDNFTVGRPPPQQVAKSAAASLRQEDASGRPSSSGSAHSQPSFNPTQLPAQNNPAAGAAFADFASRVSHMKGVFRLTAERELPGDHCSSTMWLRSALWWYLQGKAGLELILQQRRPNEPHRELLTQAHVDLAKAWWIVTDPLEAYDRSGEEHLQRARTSDGADGALVEGTAALKHNLSLLSLSMGKNQLMPPTQSLIQGQNTCIWLEYPRFSSAAAAVLGGNNSTSLIVDDQRPSADPYELLPLSDGRDFFCYGRFPVDVFLNTEESDTDRVVLPCMLTVLRGRRDYQTSVAIASQNELVSIKITPSRGDRKSLTWLDVSWKASTFGLIVRLQRGFDLSVRMQERDFRTVWNLSEYARNVEKSLRAEADEQLVHEGRLAELQYADSSNSNAFPPDKVRGCMALIYEKTAQYTDGNGMRRLHRGYRLLLITNPGHKTLSCVSHEMCRRAPLYFEFLTDPAANGTTAMVIRVREERRQCRILLVFADAQRRQAFYDVFNGLNVGPDETVVGKMTLAMLRIEAASQTEGFSQSAHPVLQSLQWQKLGVTNGLSDDPNSRIASTVESDSLRIVARHGTGCITDRLNLSKGELRLRLPVSESPAVEILRRPQEDMTMSIDTRHSPQQVSDGMGQLLHSVLHQATIRTFTFASQPDLHAFQAAITGCIVRYDGLASTLGISRRRMVVPIYKKWEASTVRLQIVMKDSVVQLMAFMEDFSHADSLCFQVKSTDVFEKIKGDSKHKKWAIKFVDAKFSLPAKEKGEVSGEELLQRRYINLEGLDYAEEHDDITVTFESEQERDRFAQALPAATSVSRGITLKRRI